MARVNHKLVKQRLNEKRSKITDKQFFSSRMLAGHFEDTAAAQTRRYHYNRRVRVNLYWKPKDAFTAATDNMQIRINTGHPLVTRSKVVRIGIRSCAVCLHMSWGMYYLPTFSLLRPITTIWTASNGILRPPALKLAAGCPERKSVLGICQGGSEESADGPPDRSEHCQYLEERVHRKPDAEQLPRYTRLRFGNSA